MQPTQFQIEREQRGEMLVLTARGEIDMASVGGLSHALETALGNGGEVWLDLCEVDFMDSTGLTALVRCHRAANDGHYRFRIICPAGPVWRAIELSGLHQVLPVYSSCAAAGAG